MSRGTVVDATVINASQSIENRQCRADPKMGKTKKQGEWRHGAKLHIGAEQIHSATVTAANVHDRRMMGSLLYGQEAEVYGDSAYLGQQETLAANGASAIVL